MFLIVFVICVAVPLASADISANNIPPYVKQCREQDPHLIDCFIGALHHLRPYLAEGIKEIELPSVEPFRMEELTLSLTTGPNGYKVSLKDIDIFGASNFTVSKLRLSERGKPFEAKIFMPQLRLNSRYQSSGVLIILPASGNGTLNGVFDDVSAVVKGTVSTHSKEQATYLHIDTLNVDIQIGNVRMAVKNLFRNNRILIEAMNLFLRENGQEVLKAMMPQLRKKLSLVFQDISNKLLSHVPVQAFYVVAEKPVKS